jgi:hypothetical protein
MNTNLLAAASIDRRPLSGAREIMIAAKARENEVSI